MKSLHPKTLRPLAALICGDEGPIYRQGWKLPLFFREIDLPCEDHDGSTRVLWTEAQLREYNVIPDQIQRIIEHLADPREYTGNPEIVYTVVEKLNIILALEGVKVSLKGITPQVHDIEPKLPQPVTIMPTPKTPINDLSNNEPTTGELLEQVESLKQLLLESADINGTDTPDMEQAYRYLRRGLLAVPRLRSNLPSFLRSCRDLNDFWAYKPRSFDYNVTASYIRESLEPIFNLLENDLFSPSDLTTSATISAFTSDHVRETWSKALDRRSTDPEGAITSARSLVESVCKFILDDLGETWEDSIDLPKLYRLTSKKLNLVPDQQTEVVFRQILGGCEAIVSGLGSLRNHLSDAHGKGKLPVRPKVRHATFAVNVAGTMATFLIETYENQKTS